ncbi:MAG TPA: APC family permease [Steroidobacteraceae bacterium]|nr:APC family permease [Steroidobacteraceae bacterium]
MTIQELVFGRRLENREYRARKLGALEAVPAMGLDALGSSAYGPEAALAALAPLGGLSVATIGWIMAPVIVLLLVLYASYRQTVAAYPVNGGAYLVARENLGRRASLLAASAIMVDYVLNVAVGISAGIGALVSAVPRLHEYTLPLCLLVLLLITLINLRGTLDAGRMFALPTYVFVASFAVVIGAGIHAAVAAGGHPHPRLAPARLPPATEAMTAWLLLRAFASGCTAMTGVEAVSDGMSAFREPPVRHGRVTLAVICAILGVLLAGISYLCVVYGIGAMDQTQAGYRSVLAQLAGAAVGEGPLYYIAMGSVLCILALSASTSFVGFPRLCRAVAEDGFLPKPFALAGHRLVSSIGILYLAATAALLLVAFDGITNRLIPLFAIGAFLTFTLSQTGMVAHWHRQLRTRASHAQELRGVRTSLGINAIGAATTGCALAVMVVAKFTEGAWITVLVIPAVILLLRSVRGYYDRLAASISEPGRLEAGRSASPVVLVAIDDWNKLSRKAVAFALTLSPEVIGVHLTQLSGPESASAQRQEALRARWQRDVAAPAAEAGLHPPRLVNLQARRRLLHEPLLNFARELERENPRRPIAVLLPQIVKRRWYQHLLHANRARRLRSLLLKHGGPGLTVIEVPWHLE